jgi:hypothetical protein
MIHITTRCQHKCRHCYVDFTHDNVADLDENNLQIILDKCSSAGLLTNITLIGGEPFIDPPRLLNIIKKIWHIGAGTLEIFIPTNGRWVAEDEWEDIVAELVKLGQWFPYGLRVAFSKNEWNISQLGELASVVMRRWSELEKRYPELFYDRTLIREEMLPLGRAKKNDLASPGKHVGVNCCFDDWYDPAPGGGFCTDYLIFFPNGDCGMCHLYYSPVIGNVHDDFTRLLDKRRDYLITLRRHITGDIFGTLGPEACQICRKFYPEWESEYDLKKEIDFNIIL